MKPIKGLLQEPVFVFGSIRVTQGTESVLTITMFEAAATLDGKTDKEPKAIKPEDQRKAFTLGPVAVLLISQDNDS